MRKIRASNALALAVAFVTIAHAEASAGSARFFRIEGAAAFGAGELDGLAVDSDGRLRLAPASKALGDAEAPYVWSMAVSQTGQVFLGTGNDGKIMRVDGGKAAVFFDSAELQVTSLAFGPDGRLYAGTSPDGRVYAVDATGKGTPYVDPDDKYIWALRFDSGGRLHIGTGGEGKVLRVGPAQKLESVFADQETHIVSLAFDAEGNVLAGSSPGGIVYRISPSGRAVVLLNSGYREIKAVVPAADGSIVAAAFGAGDKEDPARIPPTPAPLPTPSPPAGGEVTVTESFGGVAPQGTQRSTAPTETPRAGAVRGAVLKISSTGQSDVLWSSQEEAPYSLLTDDREILVGTGPKGRLYRIGLDQTFVVLSDLPGEQITALERSASGDILAATSNPGRAHSFSETGRESGTFTSKVLDAETTSSWGHVRFEADAPTGTKIEVRTRSGRTPSADSTWSDWSLPLTTAAGAANDRPDGRYLQVRVTMTSGGTATPVLHTIVAAYLQQNLRPSVTSLAIHPAGEVFQKPLPISGEAEILGLPSQDAPEQKIAARPKGPSAPPTAFSRRTYQKGFQTISWRGDDGNDDTLTYDVTYRAIGAKTWSTLREGLTEPVLAFDTQTLPNGRYVVRVTASDAPSNPLASALTHSLESEGFDIDNTPPTITTRSLAGSQPGLVAEARDDLSVIREVEFSVDGGRWFAVQPNDGIDDGLVENYDIVLPFGLSTGNHVVVIRATDALDNAATASVTVTR